MSKKYIIAALIIIVISVVLFAPVLPKNAQKTTASKTAPDRFTTVDGLSGNATIGYSPGGFYLQSTSSTELGNCQVQIADDTSSSFNLAPSQQYVIPWATFKNADGQAFNLANYQGTSMIPHFVCSQNGKDLGAVVFLSRADLDPKPANKTWLELFSHPENWPTAK